MSNPTGPGVPPYGQQPAPAPVQVPAPDDQPTLAYGAPQYPPAGQYPQTGYQPADYQQTEQYQPTAVYPPAGSPVPGPPSADTRPKRLGWIALGLAIAGLVLVGIAFVPLLLVSVVLALVGGLLLLVALVLSIVVLAAKKQGGKGLGIAALVISVVGGILSMVALVTAFVFIGLSIAASEIATPSDVTVEQTDEADATDDTEATDETETTDEVSGTYDEAAYLAAVRPEILAIMQEAAPGTSEEDVTLYFSDDTLLTMGAPFAALDETTAPTARDAFVASLQSATDDLIDAELAGRMFDVIYDAAQQYLVG